MRLVPFEEVAELVSGVTFKKSDALTSSDVGLTGILRAGNIQDGDYHLDDLVFVSDSFVKDGQRLKKGDILIASSSGSLDVVGKAAFIDTSMNSAFGAFCKVARPRVNEILPEYFKYYFHSQDYKRTVRERAEGANINNLNKGDFLSLMIPLPPLEEQKRIAGILDEADRVRKKTQALIDKYDELAQSLFLDMFGDPVTNPKGWEVRPLKSITSLIRSGNTPKGGSDVYVKKGVAFFRSQNVWKNRIVYEDMAFLDELTHQSMSKTQLMKGDLLMTKTGRFNTENSSLGRAAMYEGEDFKANVNGHVYLIRLKPRVQRRFVLHILTSNAFRDLIRRVCVGGIDKRQLNKNHIEDFPIICPPVEAQVRFCAQLKSISGIQGLLSDSKGKSKSNFDALLQKAFRGELT